MKPTIDPFFCQEMGRSFSKPSKRCEAFPTALNVNPQALCKFRSRKSVGQAGGWLGHEADSSRVEVARALIARVKAADSSINRRDELWYASDSDALDRRDWHVRRFAPADTACAWAMGR